MAKAYKCSHCGEALVLGESLFGRQFKVFCPNCKKIDNAENLLPKCKTCKALVWNAENLILKRMKEIKQ